MVRVVHTAVAVAALWLVAPGCVTPSVPIPPPQPEEMVFEVNAGDGIATFEYAPDPTYADAIVYVFNRTAGDGIITTAAANGSVGPTEPFDAVENDEIVISFETEDQLVSTCVRLREGPSSSSLECNL